MDKKSYSAPAVLMHQRITFETKKSGTKPHPCDNGHHYGDPFCQK